MPYPFDHKAKTRERILASAAQLFTSKGYEQVSIDQIMQQAGLTRGAFYSHFSDKSSLYAAAIEYTSIERFRHYAQELKAGADLNDIIESYLNQDHTQEQITPCALAFLVSDINQRADQVRETYTNVYRGLLKGLERLHASEQCERLTYLAVSTLMIGGVAIGRALADKELSEELLSACRTVSRQLLQGPPRETQFAHDCERN